MKILVVEDEHIIAKHIQLLLERLGHHVPAIATSGAEAIQYAETMHPDLVLMDIRIKGDMDGIDVAKHIYAQFNIPIIYVTSYADTATLERAKATSPFGYLLKPFEEDSLYTAIEIAQHRYAEEQRLQASEQHSRLTLASIGDAVIVTDRLGNITFLNTVAENLTGWEKMDALGAPLEKVYYTIDATTHAPLGDPLASVLRDEACVEPAVHALLRTKDGAERPIDNSVAPICDVKGHIIGAVLIFRDISERKQIEEQRLDLERKLLEAQRLESLGMLAGGMAHDFNNLLTAIIGNSELALLDLPSGSPAQVSIEQIATAARRATELTRQILAYAGKGRFVAQLFDLNALITEMPDLLQASITKHTQLMYRLAHHLPLIEGDAGQVRQIIMNMVINASEAIGDISGTITISTGVREIDTTHLARITSGTDLAPGHYVALEIADTGRGMEAATRTRIFEPFFTTKLGGRGLGLSAVQGIVRRHKGGLIVESAPGAGSIFTILLPCNQEQFDAFPVHAFQSASIAQSVSPSVLVIDDEMAVRTVTARMLETLGCRVWLAHDGMEGIQLFREHADQLTAVFLDMRMPQMNGLQVLGELQQIDPDVQVVMMSGYAEQELLYAPSLDLLPKLQKPFALRELQEMLKHILLTSRAGCTDASSRRKSSLEEMSPLPLPTRM